MAAEVYDSSVVWVRVSPRGMWHAARLHWRDDQLVATVCSPRSNYRVSAVALSETCPDVEYRHRCKQAGCQSKYRQAARLKREGITI